MKKSVLLFVWLASSFVLLSQTSLKTGYENLPPGPFYESHDQGGTDVGLYDHLRLKVQQARVEKSNSVNDDNNETKGDPKQKVAYSVTFEVNMTNAVAEGDVDFDPSVHTVYVTGTFSDWIQPGTNPDYKLNLIEKSSKNKKVADNRDKVDAIYTITLDITEGEHMYKYFLVADTPTWAIGEWAGEPNRSVFIDSPVILKDLWGSLNSYFAGGTGVEWNPFLVATAQQLNNVRIFPEAAFRQIADIDLADGDWNEGDGWQPIGNNELPFGGLFDGNGYFIDNLYINRPLEDYAGLFGVSASSFLMNIRLRNVQVTGLNRVGALCGLSFGTGITNCSAEGNISARGNWAGGLVGINYSYAIINGCYAAVNIDAKGYSIGGLAGSNENGGIISNSYATGNVSGLRNAGGLLGYTSGYSTIEFSYSTGYVSANLFAGGLIGRTSGYIYVVFSYWNSETSGQSSSAGGDALTTVQMMQNGNFEMWDFENVWNINSGNTFPYLRFQVSPGDFNYPPSFLTPSNLTAAGTDQTITISWLPPSMGTPTSYTLFRNGEVIAYPTAGATTYTDSGLENYIIHTYYLIAQYNEQESRPSGKVISFANTGFAGGNGSFGNPYLVSTPGQLFTVRHFPDSYFMQIADIDFAGSAWSQGEGWLPISTYFEAFQGTYDGNDHIVYNLFIDRDINIYQGLFSTLEGTIINLGVVDANINTPSGMCGILTGVNFGEIINCYSSGEVNSSGTFGRLGGLAGWNSGLIINSWSSANINNNGMITGGLTGANADGIIDASYSTGNVIGGSSTGGLTGINQSASIYNSYSKSQVVATGERTGGFAGSNSFSSFISESYSTGSVLGISPVGGFVSYLSDDSYIWGCYTTGPVTGVEITGGLVAVNTGWENVMQSYWDSYTTGQNISAGGIPKNTQEMVLQQTFTNWDFTEVWKIMEGQSYPYLWWQIEPGAHNLPSEIHLFYYLSLVANPPIGGSVTGAGSYTHNQVVSISAVCNPGYIFMGWTGHTNFVDHSDHEVCNVTMPAENIVLTANFELNTSIEETNLSEMAVYPNPANERLWIEFDNISGGPVLVQISNILGKVAEQKEFNNQGKVSLEIDISSCHAGLYVVKIQTGASILIRKVLIRN